MSTFLERYQSGELTEVWEEIRALEDQCWLPPFKSDVLGVVSETLNRARTNIDTLIKCLRAEEYEFVDPSGPIYSIDRSRSYPSHRETSKI